VLPLCAEHAIPYVPFSPLSGGWLTGKYRRGEQFPEGSRMTQRPGPYERLIDDRVFDGLDLLRAEAEARGVEMAAWHSRGCSRIRRSQAPSAGRTG